MLKGRKKKKRREILAPRGINNSRSTHTQVRIREILITLSMEMLKKKESLNFYVQKKLKTHKVCGYWKKFAWINEVLNY